MESLLNQIDIITFLPWLTIGAAAALFLYKLYKILIRKFNFLDFILLLISGAFLVLVYQRGFDYLKYYIQGFLQ